MSASIVQQLEPPQLIVWTGKTSGIKAIHVHTLEPRNGKTLVKTEEPYEGLIARVFRGSLQKTLDTALADGLRHLKVEAERQCTRLRPARNRGTDRSA
jgi:hypothetical protein